MINGLINIYSEINENRLETRKIHEHTSGKLIKIGEFRRFSNRYDMGLAEKAIDPLEEFEEDKNQLEVNPITKEEFDFLWRKAKYSR
ncbi:MAG: hypothetical protein WAU96_13645 [Anaerolineae bacterium]